MCEAADMSMSGHTYIRIHSDTLAHRTTNYSNPRCAPGLMMAGRA